MPHRTRPDPRTPAVKALKAISDVLEKYTGCLCMILVALMLGIVVVQIVLRAFRASVPWSEELSRMILIWIGMLGAGIAAKKDLHVGVDFLSGVLPFRLGRLLKILIKALLISFLIFIVKQGYLSALDARRVGAATMTITMYGPKLALPVGAACIAVHLLYLISAELEGLTGRQPGED